MTTIIKTIVDDAEVKGALRKWGEGLPAAINQETLRQALRLKTIMVEGIRISAPGGKAFKENAQSTIDAKGSSKPLIDNADFINSIDADEVGRDQFFVGVNRSVETPDGDSMANLAEILNDGTKPDSNGKQHIPARPYIEPSYEEWEKDLERQFTEGLLDALGKTSF